METLDELKKSWTAMAPDSKGVDEKSMKKIIKSRISKHIRQAFNYFWASLTLQIMMYALLSYVIITHWDNLTITLPGVGGILLFLPFTFILRKKFKDMVAAPLHGTTGDSVFNYIQQQRSQLENILHFKKRYELILIPLINVVGIVIPFAMYVPEGLSGHLQAAAFLYVLSLLVCFITNQVENRKSFLLPMQRLDSLLKEYTSAI